MISLGFSSREVSEGQHICYIYNDDDERLEVMTKYLKSGQQAKEKLLYLVDAMTSAEMLAFFERAGVDVSGAIPGGLTVAEAAPAYCPEGFFKTEEMLETVKAFYLGALDEGFSGARGTGEMSWCLTDGRADYVDLMTYEAGLTKLVVEYPYTACCQYDARRFDGRTIMDVLSVHPMMIVRGQLVNNPYCIAPDEFLARLQQRSQGARDA
jgi:hypothetical protein